ncbi:MAG: hypothetical protein JNL34_02905 [Anaerolineae bacterium]|nr:hypothetical protein [Anaerolineae bacterium]
MTHLQAESSDNADSFSLRILISRCFIHYLNGDTDRLHQMARLLIERASDTSLATLSNWGQYFLGVVHYEQNQLDAAAEHFMEAINHRYSAQALTGRASFVGLALTRLAQGNSGEALAVLAQLSEYDLATLSAETSETQSLRARLQLATDQTASAARWADSFVAPPASQPLLWLDEPRLTWAEILIALRKPGDVEAALEYLDELLEQAMHTHNCFVQVRILVMRGQALSALNPPRTGEALQELRRAIELAEPGNLIHPFLEAGKPITKLLDKLAEENDDGRFIARIAAEGSIRFTGPERSSPPGDTRPVEPLTVREHAVLTLMQQRLTDKEIAQRLSISVQTAKRHAANIYVKLGVSRRWDAVTLAEAQGLLTPVS